MAMNELRALSISLTPDNADDVENQKDKTLRSFSFSPSKLKVYTIYDPKNQ